MTAVVLVFAALFGLAVGSFLNVVVYRLPRRQNLSDPPSRCPSCNTRLKWRDNIPVLSWVWLRGKCRYCGVGISAQYPLVELATGVAFVAVALVFV